MLYGILKVVVVPVINVVISSEQETCITDGKFWYVVALKVLAESPFVNVVEPDTVPPVNVSPPLEPVNPFLV
jgi:hypothetical protein